MPIHDWTRVEAGLFHDFHQVWSIELKHALNRSVLPKDYYTLIEHTRPPIQDPVVIDPDAAPIICDPPRARFVMSAGSDETAYARGANRLSIRRTSGEMVAAIDVVSPGNKNSRVAVRSFVEQAVDRLRAGIHLLIVDLFPPTKWAPAGLHQEVWGEFQDESFEFSRERPLILASYMAVDSLTAYVDPVSVGDSIPSMPLFLQRDRYVTIPLEETYAATWAETPEPIREMLLTPRP